MLLRPRNTLVACRVLEKADVKRVRAILVPGNNEMYTEAVVLAVGPGNLSAAGAVSETHDLKAGQVVWVKSVNIRQMAGQMVKAKEGVEYQNGDDVYTLFEQMNIIGIIADSIEEYEVIRAANEPKPRLALAN